MRPSGILCFGFGRARCASCGEGFVDAFRLSRVRQPWEPLAVASAARQDGAVGWPALACGWPHGPRVGSRDRHGGLAEGITGGLGTLSRASPAPPFSTTVNNETRLGYGMPLAVFAVSVDEQSGVKRDHDSAVP